MHADAKCCVPVIEVCVADCGEGMCIGESTFADHYRLLIRHHFQYVHPEQSEQMFLFSMAS